MPVPVAFAHDGRVWTVIFAPVAPFGGRRPLVGGHLARHVLEQQIDVNGRRREGAEGVMEFPGVATDAAWVSSGVVVDQEDSGRRHR